jgi:cation diffusion facilitator family transporter
LTASKAVVGALSGSLAILSEAGHSLIDLGATVMTYFAVRASGRPADAEHHYGHGKIESVVALVATALLFLLSGVVMWEAVKRLLDRETPHVDANIWAFAVIIISIIVDFFRARVLYRTAADTSSQALEADALHFGSDMWSSVAVLVGLAAVLYGFDWADAAAALVVAVFVCLAGWRLARRTIDALTDTAPAGVAEDISAIASQVSGVVSVDRVRVRPVGNILFVDLILGISRTLPFDRVAFLKETVASAIQRQFRDAEVTIITEPRTLDSETVLERVMVIARNQALAVHHVIAQSIGDKLSVSLDLEVDGNLELAVAHDIASRLENAIREELGPDIEVETHIEPLQPPYGLAGNDARSNRTKDVSDALTEIAKSVDFVGEIHHVRVRETPEGEIVNFHCLVDSTLTVDAVHERVDELERALRQRWPAIKRVIGHAEPRGQV